MVDSGKSTHADKLPEGRVSLSGFAPGKCLMIDCVWEWGFVYTGNRNATPFVRAVWCKPTDYPSDTAKSHIIVLKPGAKLYDYLRKHGIYDATEGKKDTER